MAGQGRRAAIAAARTTDLGLAEFLHESGLDLDDVYDGSKSWSDLRQAAGAPILPPGPNETVLRRAIGRLLHVDDRERIDTYQRLLAEPDATDVERARRARAPTPPHARRRRHRSAITRETSAPGGHRPALGPSAGPQRTAASCSGCSTTGSTTCTLRSRRTPTAPLQIHARYSRIEILAAFGLGSGAKIAAWQSGVYEARPRTPNCSRSRSTRAAAASPPRPATATTPSAAP